MRSSASIPGSHISLCFCSRSGASCRRPPPFLRRSLHGIAEASFVRTMYQALKLCLPITLMTFCDLHPLQPCGEPGMAADTGYAARGGRLLGRHLLYLREVLLNRASNHINARRAGARLVRGDVPPKHQCVYNGGCDRPYRRQLYGVIRHRKIAPPKSELQSQPAGT